MIQVYYHVTEYCDWYTLHAVWGDKLLYGRVPEPFPWCGIGSGSARLDTRVGPCD